MMWESFSRQQNTTTNACELLFRLETYQRGFMRKVREVIICERMKIWVVLCLFFMKNALNTVAFSLIVLKYQWQRQRVTFYFIAQKTTQQLLLLSMQNKIS